MVLQNLTGVGIAALYGLPPHGGLLAGTVSLLGGHGTAIAWAPVFTERYGIPNALEIGLTAATFGLVLASTIGGPVAGRLIRKHRLTPTEAPGHDVGVSIDEPLPVVDYVGFLRAVLAIHLSISLGVVINAMVSKTGLKLPLFVPCLLAGIILANLVPRLLPFVRWPSRDASLALIADLTLGIFLTMSLMSLRLWAVVGLAAPLFTILVAQLLIVIAMSVFVVFRVMGRNYSAAIICAGFAGYSLGSTTTAMANMSAVTQRHGPSHLAFVIVPLVCAFFLDVANAFFIQAMLAILT
jgi:ESS family glutamate:Na+ symporter